MPIQMLRCSNYEKTLPILTESRHSQCGIAAMQQDHASALVVTIQFPE